MLFDRSSTDTVIVNMSGDDLKSAEKRAADAAIEKENMRVAMTATEQKAISTTYVLIMHFQPGNRAMPKKETSYSTLDSIRAGGVWGLSCVRHFFQTCHLR